jgi:PKD repeat protein
LKNIPELVKDIQTLKVLEMRYTSLDSIPSWFGTGYLNGLEELYVDNNRIKTVPVNFRELKSLKKLSMSYNSLDGTWPPFYDSLQNMEYINLSRNPRLDVLPDMTRWTKLKEINLEYDSLYGAVPKFLTSVDNSYVAKTSVYINNNFYSNIEPGARFTGMPFVRVGFNRLTFEDILQLKPDVATYYTYSPQPNVDKQRNVYAYPGGYAIFIAHVDTLTSLHCTFQWFKVGSPTPVSPILTSKEFRLNGIAVSDNNAKYYYIIRNPNAPNLTLTSENQTLIISCQAAVSTINFSAKRYICAMNFKPSVSYVASECRNVSYLWSFGDGGTSTEKSPWHAYAGNGTYHVSLKVSFACGPCSADSTFTKPVTYNLASPSEMVRDSTIQVSTTDALEVLSVSAATFSDAWPLQLPTDVNGNGSFENGTQGVWRNDGMYVYDVPRAKSAQTTIARDGTFPLDRFNWELAEADAIPHWTQANEMTQYSPYSYELENRDVLGIYSAALYDYGGHLPSANGVNMRNNEMAFTGFEYTRDVSSGNLIFTNTPLPAYSFYKVVSAIGHVATVEATLDQLYNVQYVDVNAKAWLPPFFNRFRKTSYIQDDEVICMQPHPTNEKWSILVLRREPFEGSWTGQIKVKNIVEPFVTASIDSVVTAHTGKKSMRINAATSFKQQLLHLDSGKTYFLNAWVSINNIHLTTPSLGSGIGVTVIFKNRDNVTVLSQTLQPSGAIINGWQQVRGSFTVPDDRLQLELKFDNGSVPAVWFDDIRLHPDKGNMKSYVYNLHDYRLSAVLDEENFATLYFYDEEGNLHLVKKETARGIKTISENISYQIERE